MSNLEERACKALEESCLKAFEAGKQSQDAEMERLKTLNETLTETNAELASLVLKTRNQVDELQKRIDAGLEKIRQFGKEGCLFPEWLTWAEKALRGKHE